MYVRMHACMYICMNGLYMVHACTYDVSCIVCMNGCMIISITYGEYMPIYIYDYMYDFWCVYDFIGDFWCMYPFMQCMVYGVGIYCTYT